MEVIKFEQDLKGCQGFYRRGEKKAFQENRLHEQMHKLNERTKTLKRTCLKLINFILFIYFLAVGSQLQHVGSSFRHERSFIAVRRLLSRCGVLVFLFSSCGTWAPECGLYSLWYMGSPVEVRGLSSCGVWAQLPHGMWDLSSLTRDQTHVPCIGRQSLYHWTTGEVPTHKL